MAKATKANVTKKEGGTTQGVTIQNIVIRPAVVKTQDIGTWRSAYQNAIALNPIRVPLYDLFADIKLDTVLSSIIEKRILGVTKSKLTFTDSGGNEVEEMVELISRKQFRRLRKEMMQAKMWGISVLELTRVNGELNVFSAPRKHIKPNLGKITFEQYGQDGIDYREPPYNKYIFQVGDDDDLGLLLQAAPYVVYKRGGFGDWANYCEMFGIPFREARYDGYNDVVRKQLEQALDAVGSAQYAILPKEAELTIHETANTQGTGMLYDMLRKACNEEMSILILGQSSTTIATPGKLGNDDTNANTEDDINIDDLADEMSLLNEQVLPILETLGYPVAGGRFTEVPVKEQLPLKDKAAVYNILKNQLGMPLDEDELYEEFGAKKPDDYDAQKAQQKADKEATTAGGTPPKPPAKPAKKAAAKTDDKLSAQLTTLEGYLKRMDDFFGEAPTS